ncbi:MAG: hydroxymethylglutaryl-CoA lyase [Rhodospirillales bacterium]
MGYPKFVKIVEVGPRDGLQNELGFVPTETKVSLIHKLADCGLSMIEAGAFVSPKWVPQMADGADVFAAIEKKSGVVYSALTPNMKGLEAAMAAGVEEIAVFVAGSESFSKKNTNCTIAESIERFLPLCDVALKTGISVRGYVSCVLGCPYEGEISTAVVAELSARLMDGGCYEVSLGDTIGCGTPAKAQALVNEVGAAISRDKIAVHFHDTYGQDLANIHAVLQQGISVVDSSVAGLGGCPYAKGASGNVATEDVLYMLNGLGLDTGIDMIGLLKASAYITGELSRPPSSKVALALNGPVEAVV